MRYSHALLSLDVGAGKLHKGKIAIDLLPRLRPDIVADMTYLPLRDGSADSLVSSHSIEHVRNFEGAIIEMKRVLQNGGLAFFFLPNDGSRLWKTLEPLWSAYYGRFVIREASPHSHVASFTPESFRHFIVLHFQILATSTMNFGMEIYAVCKK